jgi:hypothetical protein
VERIVDPLARALNANECLQLLHILPLAGEDVAQTLVSTDHGISFIGDA